MPEPRDTCLCLLLDIEPAARNINLYLSENVAESIQDSMFRLRSSSFHTTYVTDIAQARRAFEKTELLTSVSYICC